MFAHQNMEVGALGTSCLSECELLVVAIRPAVENLPENACTYMHFAWHVKNFLP